MRTCPASPGSKGMRAQARPAPIRTKGRRSYAPEVQLGIMQLPNAEQNQQQRCNQLRVHQKPLLTCRSPLGGCVIAALRHPNWRRHAVRLTCEFAGPLLYRYVKTEWYRRP